MSRAEELLANETSEMCGTERLSSLGLLALSTLGQLYGFRGDGPAVVNTLTKAAKGWRQWGKTANLSWVLNNLAMGHLIVGDFESAVEALREARSQGQLYGNARNVAYATASPSARPNWPSAISTRRGSCSKIRRACSRMTSPTHR